jgi:hypothetical protein
VPLTDNTRKKMEYASSLFKEDKDLTLEKAMQKVKEKFETGFNTNSMTLIARAVRANGAIDMDRIAKEATLESMKYDKRKSPKERATASKKYAAVKAKTKKSKALQKKMKEQPFVDKRTARMVKYKHSAEEVFVLLETLEEVSKERDRIYTISPLGTQTSKAEMARA